MACLINESISVSHDMFGVVHNLHGQIFQIFDSQKFRQNSGMSFWKLNRYIHMYEFFSRNFFAAVWLEIFQNLKANFEEKITQIYLSNLIQL